MADNWQVGDLALCIKQDAGEFLDGPPLPTDPAMTTNPFPPARWLEQHNARVAAIIHAADVERFLRREFGDDTQETER